MKFLSVILSLLTIFLSSYPCCQETDSCVETMSISNCGDDGLNDDRHEEEAPCSPFYTCGRCSGFTMTNIGFTDIVVNEVDIKINTVYYQELIPKEVYFHDLKPPRSFEV